MECEAPIPGVSELKLFAHPGIYRLRLYHQSRVDESGMQVRPDPNACRQGQPGVRKWEHGRVACWWPQGRSSGVLLWSDERSNLSGLIRVEPGSAGRLLGLWRDLMAELETDAAETPGDPPSGTT